MEPAQRTQRTHRGEAALAHLSSTQHGLFTRKQARAAGYSASAISRRLTSGAWIVVDSSVYKHASTPSSWKQRLMAACLAGPAVASHRSAGFLWSLPEMSDELVEVTTLRHRRRRASDVIWHESFHLEERDVIEIDGIPVTRPVRTFLDLAGVLTDDQLEEVLNEGIRRNLVSVPAIWRRMEQLGELRRGAKRARRVLERHVPRQRPPDTVLETKYVQLLRNAGVPTGIPQFEIRKLDGKPAFLDFAYPDLMLGVELDGDASHFGARRSRSDQARENDLQALGWRILRFDWDDVTKRPDYVVQMVRAALRPSA
jgi:very-short-patch-repair endonuclease